MSKTLSFCVEAPKKDEASINYFFKNINYIVQHKAIVLNKADFYYFKITGMGISSIHGERELSIGEYLKLATDNPEFQNIIHTTGNPMSGMNNSSIWNEKTKQIEYMKILCFSKFFKTAFELQKTKPCFDQSQFDEVDKKLVDIFQHLLKLKMSFCQKCEKIKIKNDKKKERSINTSILPDICSVPAMFTKFNIVGVWTRSILINKNQFVLRSVKAPHSTICFTPDS